MTNFLKETLEAIKNSGHAVEDIAWIGSFIGDEYCSWDEFTQLADREYDGGVRYDLVVVFKDGTWLERWEDDMGEGWSYKYTPVLKRNAKKLSWVFYE